MFKFQISNQKSQFTLIEIMLVVAILSIIMGMLLPSLGKAKYDARYIRWTVFNAGFNHYPETVINYNFLDQNFKVDYDDEKVNALRNGAEGCTLDGFDLKDYHGVLNGPEWLTRKGRWDNLSNALYFDGIDDYVEVPGVKVLNFHHARDDFTVSMWVKFKNVKTGLEVLFSKSRWPDYCQCAVYRNKKNIEVEIGDGNIFDWTDPEIKTGEWYHLAFVNTFEDVRMYLNGERMTEKDKKKEKQITIMHYPPAKGVIQTITMSQWLNYLRAGGRKDYIIIDDDSTLNQSKVFIGAAGMASNPNPRYFFNGQIDEVVFIRQALTPEQIRGIYQMENSD